MTKKEVVKWLESLKREIGKAENHTLWHYAESIDMAIEALFNATQQTQRVGSVDPINRQDAIDAINHICPIDTEYDCTLLDRVDVRCVLSDLPSAEPKTKCIAQIRIDRADIEDIVNKKVNEIVDKMVEPKKGAWGAHGECPYCGYLRQWDDDNFCANCGANMRGDTE